MFQCLLKCRPDRLLCLLLLSATLSTALTATASSDFTPSTSQEDLALDDLMSPDEIAEERGEMTSETSGPLFQDLITKSSVDSQVRIIINKAHHRKSKSAQRMWVYIDGELEYYWPVSTGRETPEEAASGRRYFSRTPVGTWTPSGMTLLHRSNLWRADMPYSIWLTGGIAIHAAARKHESKLGTRASGGCIRLSHRNAALLYQLVKQVGRTNVRVTIMER